MHFVSRGLTAEVSQSSPPSLNFLFLGNVNFTFLFYYVVYARPRVCASVCVCARARCGLCLICCLRNTITFLLSDRVSRHTRDRARQCALETGDGARAPKPSASFTDREPSTPLEITRRLASLRSRTRKLRVRYEAGLF